METLYNGIVLQGEFPPRSPSSCEPDYLKNPPEIINISVGRQLFTDDFLIADTSLEHAYHKAVKYEGNPVLFPETEWETVDSPVACPKSGGVWYDERERIFKMWYEAAWLHQMCYATSKDGIHWERPDLGDGTNKILKYDGFALDKMSGGLDYLRPDSTTVFIDKTSESQRYKLYLRNPGGGYPGIVATSRDGVNFENFRFGTEVYDRSTMFYNPFRKKWVYSIRDGWCNRSRSYRECDDYLEGAVWRDDEKHQWLACDALDKPNPYIGFAPQLYNVDCVGYESIMLGMFQIMYGPENDKCEARGVPKITELIPMYSRDGYNFTRPCRDSVIGASIYAGAWDRGYVQSVGGVTIIHGDELWIYYAGFGGDESFINQSWFTNGIYRNGATGLAKLRRDGFVSMRGNGSLTTRLMSFDDNCGIGVNLNGGSRELRVNFDGSLTASILSPSGDILAKASVNGDSTDLPIRFDGFELASLKGNPFRLRFDLSGDIYSFRVTDSVGTENGAGAAGRL